MSALPYLRVKNWAKLQHYSDRRPPWIKAYQGLLGDDQDFARIEEFTQWQLMRVWILASRSELVTVENGKNVPVVVNDAGTLQRSIMSLKKIPLAMFIRDGWLIPVAAADVFVAPEAKKKGNRASKVLAPAPSETGDVASTRASASLKALEGLEVLGSSSGRQFENQEQGLPIENEFLSLRLLQAIGDHADQGTAHIVRSHAAKLPQAALAKVIESLGTQPGIRNRAKYAVSALGDELAERENVA